MYIKKRNGFWTFLFSFIPGCAEMYWGAFKSGTSLLIAFIASIFLGSFFEIGAFVFVAVAIWTYGFFHARNLASLSQEELAYYNDEYLFFGEFSKEQFRANKRMRTIAGLILMFIGAWSVIKMVFNVILNVLPPAFYDVMMDIINYVPRVVISIAIFFLGLYMLGKRSEMEEIEDHTASSWGTDTYTSNPVNETAADFTVPPNGTMKTAAPDPEEKPEVYSPEENHVEIKLP